MQPCEKNLGGFTMLAQFPIFDCSFSSITIAGGALRSSSRTGILPPIIPRPPQLFRGTSVMRMFLLVVLLLAVLSVQNLPSLFVLIVEEVDLSPQLLGRRGGGGGQHPSSPLSSGFSSTTPNSSVPPLRIDATAAATSTSVATANATSGRTIVVQHHHPPTLPNASLPPPPLVINDVVDLNASSVGAVAQPLPRSADSHPSTTGALLGPPPPLPSNVTTTLHQQRKPPLPLTPLKRRFKWPHGNGTLNATNDNGPVVLSHILEREAATGWWLPRLHSLTTLPLIDQGCFPDPSTINFRAYNGSVREYLGVVRITKTGSTSLLNYFNAAEQLQTWDKALDFPLFRDVLGKHALKTNLLTPPCVFGYHRDPGTNVNKDVLFPGFQCQHLGYFHLVNVWARSLAFLKENSYVGKQRIGHPGQSLRVTLDVVTILREPLDRYLSYFHYWRSIYPAWNGTAQKLERQALIDGDFPAFVETIAHAPKRGMNSAFQYEYLSHDINYAVSLLEDGRLLPLINECFNASVLLLQRRYPQFFGAAETRAFLESEDAGSNRRWSGAGPAGGNGTVPNAAHDAPVLRRGLRPVQPYDPDDLRQQARVWLDGDYRLYDAGVNAFRRAIHRSMSSETGLLDPSVVEECEARLVGGGARRPLLIHPGLATSAPPPATSR